MKDIKTEKESNESNNLNSTLRELKDNKMQVSILIDNCLPNENRKESYVGHIVDFDNDFIYLGVDYSKKIFGIIINRKMILSIWLYRTNAK